MLLNELFNRPAKFEIDVEGDDEFVADATVNGKHLHFYAHNEDEMDGSGWRVGFLVDGLDAITKTGDQIPIFSTVMSILEYFGDVYKPDVVKFESSGGSRDSLYKRLVLKFAAQFGYEPVDMAAPSTNPLYPYNHFTLKKKNKKFAERAGYREVKEPPGEDHDPYEQKFILTKGRENETE